MNGNGFINICIFIVTAKRLEACDTIVFVMDASDLFIIRWGMREQNDFILAFKG